MHATIPEIAAPPRLPPDDPLNFHHLRYFWMTAREGSIVRASRALLLSPPAVSRQLRDLERSLGGKLFERRGRGLVLTDFGRTVQSYAEEIFTLGTELVTAARSRPTEARPARLVVGISDVLPKLAVHRLLAPALAHPGRVRLTCREDRTERLLAELSVEALDLLLTDAPLPPRARVRAFCHLLGESGVTFCAAPAMARRLRRGFPRSLDGAPILLPTAGAALRHELERWFAASGVRPHVIAEFDDSALLKVFGREGAGAFAVPSLVEQEVLAQYRVARVGRAEDVRERFYAVSAERRVTTPILSELLVNARAALSRCP